MQNLINAISHYVTLNKRDIELIEQLFVRKELKKNDFFLQPGKYVMNLLLLIRDYYVITFIMKVKKKLFISALRMISSAIITVL
jgi:hypothetical protein